MKNLPIFTENSSYQSMLTTSIIKPTFGSFGVGTLSVDGNLLHPDDHEKVQNAIQTFPAGTNYVAFKTNRNASVVHYIVVQNGVTVTQWLIAR